MHFREMPGDLHSIRFQVPMPERVALNWFDYPAVSPDGRQMVISGTTPDGKRLLWMHPLDSLGTEALTGTEDAYWPFWSTDNRFVAFFTGVTGAAPPKLKKVGVAGGPVETICDLPPGMGRHRDQ
jgi:hypothetical protein